tara:strand:- start:521 stop:808 length:288 start_codon:yes stop_codon:yes gene_type:complete
MIKYIVIIAFLVSCASIGHEPCPMYCAIEHDHKYSKKDKEFLDWYAKEFIKYKQTEREYKRARHIADSLQVEMVKDVIMEVDSVWFDTTGSDTNE